MRPFPASATPFAIAALALLSACGRDAEAPPPANTTEVSSSDEGSISDAMVTNIGVSAPESNIAEPGDLPAATNATAPANATADTPGE